MRTWGMWKVCLQTFRGNKICSKLVYFLRDLQTSRANNPIITRIKNAKFSGYCFYTQTNREIFKSTLKYFFRISSGNVTQPEGNYGFGHISFILRAVLQIIKENVSSICEYIFLRVEHLYFAEVLYTGFTKQNWSYEKALFLYTGVEVGVAANA